MIEKIERLNVGIGRLCSWLCLAMVLTTVAVVILRYAFDIGLIWLQEAVVWMHAATFMLAAAYTLAREEHVRVDIFYGSFSARGKAWVDCFGTLFFLLPVTAFIVWVSWDYVGVSWAIREASGEAGGLPFPFPSLLKSLIILSAALLMLQGIVLLVRSLAALSSDRT